MKSVLISIRPKWCELIASGKKTVEVRKTKPKLDIPFKVYIYETKGRTEIPTFIDEDGHEIYEGRGQVIGEFVCDSMTEFRANNGIQTYYNDVIKDTCLSDIEIIKYASGKQLYGWHISDLVIYDKPKELREFLKPCIDPQRYCKVCTYRHVIFHSDIYDEDYEIECSNRVMKPPQSWCYVEEG